MQCCKKTCFNGIFLKRQPSLFSYPVEDRDEHGGGGDDDDDRDDEAGDQQEDGVREVLRVRPVRSATE